MKQKIVLILSFISLSILLHSCLTTSYGSVYQKSLGTKTFNTNPYNSK